MSDPATDNVSIDLSGAINLPSATEDQDGLVELANVSETRAGTDDTQAVTPAGAAATYIPLSALSAKGDLLTLSGCDTRVALRVGTNGQVLTACSSSATGLCWAPLPPASIPCSCLTSRGVLITASAPGTPSALPVGSSGQILTANPASTMGLCWTTPPPPSIPRACITSKGALITGTAFDSPSALPVGLNGQILTACSTTPTGLCWASPAVPSIPCTCITGKGTLITGERENVPTALPLGTQGQILTVNSNCNSGLEWSNIGKTVSFVGGPGVAMGMDNLRVCFTQCGNRTWAFATASGSEVARIQTTSATGNTVATQQLRSVTLNSSIYTELGWSFTLPASCATYLICLGPVNAPNSIYCFVGMVGCNYSANLFHLTRLF